MKADLEEGDNSTSTISMEEVEAKLQEITELANKAKSLLLSDRYHEAAKSYDNASVLSAKLSEEY